MIDAIKQKIEQIKNGKIPEGYQQTRVGIAPNDWIKGSLSDILYNKKRSVPKPTKPYWRIGIRSHAKGTFHEYVENPDTVSMDELYVVKENDLIVNITFAWEHAIALADKKDDGLLVSHRFPTYVFKKGQIPYFYKNIVVQNRFKELLALISPGGAGRNRVMSKKDFLQLPCLIPPLKEQRKIAEILMQCDKVIELYEQEIEELKKLKTAYLRKMFPKKGENVPELRFAGFTDPWEQRKLSSLCDKFTDGDWIEAKDQSNSGVRLIQTGNVGVAEYLDKPNNKKWVSNYTFETLHCEEVFEGDILISRLPEPAGRACIVPNLGTKMITAVDCTIVRVSENTSNRFLLQYLSSQKYFNEVNACLAGGTRQRISRSNLAAFDVPIPPSLEEQESIGTFLCGIDNLITLHQRKLEEQQKQKKSLMQLLLTGIVRVKI